jgi:arginine/lysine/ornithine decarboxylase
VWVGEESADEGGQFLQILDAPAKADPPLRHAVGLDLTKITLGLTSYDISGFALAAALAQRGIIAERAELNSIELIATFQLPAGAVAHAADAITDLLARRVADQPRAMLGNPFRTGDHPHRMRAGEVHRYAKSLAQQVPLAEAVGRIAAESVELYPPGIPLVLEGYEVIDEAVAYMLAAAGQGASIVARDPSLATLSVLGPARPARNPGRQDPDQAA